MECPNCKYPNEKGAPYCHMCYEVFSRSAADTYLRQVRREKYETQKKIDRSPSGVRQIADIVNWKAVLSTTWRAILRFRRALLYAAAVILVLFLWTLGRSPDIHLALGGAHLTYRFVQAKPVHMLVGFRSHWKQWAEHQGSIDTQIDDHWMEEIGRILLTKESPGHVAVDPSEWLITDRQGEKHDDHIIPLQSPALASGMIIFNRKGVVVQRRFSLLSRLGHYIPFIAPVTPPKRLHKDDHWNETIEWTDFMGDWKIHWSADLRWTLDGEAPCSVDSCDHLVYRATLRPRLIDGPSWNETPLNQARFSPIVAQGEALFDRRAGALYGNTATYSGWFRIPINDVARAPRPLRTSRRKHSRFPGDIVVQFENRLDIRNP